jgi:hypothetical protein
MKLGNTYVWHHRKRNTNHISKGLSRLDKCMWLQDDAALSQQLSRWSRLSEKRALHTQSRPSLGTHPSPPLLQTSLPWLIRNYNHVKFSDRGVLTLCTAPAGIQASLHLVLSFRSAAARVCWCATSLSTPWPAWEHTSAFQRPCHCRRRPKRSCSSGQRQTVHLVRYIFDSLRRPSQHIVRIETKNRTHRFEKKHSSFLYTES